MSIATDCFFDCIYESQVFSGKVVLESVLFCCVIASPRFNSLKVVSVSRITSWDGSRYDTTLKEWERGNAITQQKGINSRITLWSENLGFINAAKKH